MMLADLKWGRALIGVLGWGLFGCQETTTIQCGEVTCPSGRICSEPLGFCVSEQSVEACEGKEELELCPLEGGGDGRCFSGVCLQAGCGNGVLEPDEVCDDQNTDDGDGCSANCLSDESCGNGVVDLITDEQCDDGDLETNDGCDDACLLEFCGNGALEDGEVCDDGNFEGGDGCSADCLSDESCGNGRIDSVAGEVCDDGNRKNGDGCSRKCLLELCGDGNLDPGEECDDGNRESGDACNPACLIPACGNGYPDVGEACDDGNTSSRDGCSAECEPETPHFATLPTLLPPGEGAMVYDEDREATVLMITDPEPGLWEFVDSRFRFITDDVPPATENFGMAYDPDEHRILISGGEGGKNLSTNYLVKTWAIEGDSWTEIVTADAPTYYNDTVIAYDRRLDQLVAFGFDLGGASETWVFENDDWTKLTPAVTPPGRERHQMVYHEGRERVVLFGGRDYDQMDPFADTWEFNGTNWTEIATVQSPPETERHVMTYDPINDRILLNDGTFSTWAYDGTWSEIVGDQIVSLSRTVIGFAVDEQEGVPLLFGLTSSSQPDPPQLWALEGSDWVDRTSPVHPFPRVDGAMASEGGLTLLFGGADEEMNRPSEVWVDRGQGWELGQEGPAGRIGHTLVGDGEGEILLFGGQTDAGEQNDFWTYDGESWTESDSDDAPPARFGHGMTRLGESLFVFGGRDGSDPLNDLWEYTDGAWREVTLADGPSARSYAGFQSLEAEGLLMLVGGVGASGLLDDTWVFDGAAWTEIDGHGPGARQGAALVYHPVREKVILFGGASLSLIESDVWEFSHGKWRQVAPFGIWGGGLFPCAAYETNREQVVLFGGRTDRTVEALSTTLFGYQ